MYSVRHKARELKRTRGYAIYSLSSSYASVLLKKTFFIRVLLYASPSTRSERVSRGCVAKTVGIKNTPSILLVSVLR